MLFNKNNCCNRQMELGPQMMGYQGQMECPVIEPTINKCVEREFYHEVPHVCPIHTHTINKHVYTHTYTPQYTCSEEDQIINNDCGSCSGLANNNWM